MTQTNWRPIRPPPCCFGEADQTVAVTRILARQIVAQSCSRSLS
jgi:hypothetical protein